jgi:hypothetical protein
MGMDPISVVFTRVRVRNQAYPGVPVHQQIPEHLYCKTVDE